MVLDSFFNSIFGWAIDISPVVGIAVVSFVMTFMATMAHKLMTDQKFIGELKKEMKEIRKEIKEAAQDPARMTELNKKSMEKSMLQMKHTFKPILITMIPILLVFGWLRSTYETIPINFFGIHSWLWTYFILAIIFSLVLKKILKVI